MTEDVAMSLEEILEQFDNENGTKENSKERIELESCVHRKKWCESSIKRLKEMKIYLNSQTIIFLNNLIV